MALALGLISLVAIGQAAEQSPNWLTGASLQRRLAEPFGLHWQQNPLRAGLHDLAVRRQVAIMLDRRIDPDQPVDFTFQDRPLQDALAELANSRGWSLSRIGPVLYIGPPDTAGKLATLVALQDAAIRKFPAHVRRRLQLRHPCHAPMLTTPRDLLSEVAQRPRVSIANADVIPHDLWPSLDLPPLTIVESCTLILAGFDRTLQWQEDGTATIVEIPAEVVWRQTYAANSLAARRAREYHRPSDTWRMEATGDRLTVIGRWEDHQLLQRGPPSRPSARPDDTRLQRFTLKVQQQPLMDVLTQVAERLGLTIRIQPAARQSLERRIDLDVAGATVDQLLEALLRPAGLTHRLEGTALHIDLIEP